MLNCQLQHRFTMRHDTQQLLSGADPPEHIVHEEVAQDSHAHECGKKHGIFCRIMTTLHLKKKGSGRRHRLLSESQEHLPYHDDHSMQPQLSKKSKKTAKDEKSAKTTKPKKLSSSISAPLGTPRRKSTLSGNRNNSNNLFSTAYETLDNESHHSCELLFEPENQSTPPAEQMKEPVVNATMRDIHIYGDEHFGESYISKTGDTPLIDEPKSHGTGQYIKHKWQGKRAKQTRKRIRRAMRATLLSLQSVTNAGHAFPTPHTVASAVSSSGRR